MLIHWKQFLKWLKLLVSQLPENNFENKMVLDSDYYYLALSFSFLFYVYFLCLFDRFFLFHFWLIFISPNVALMHFPFFRFDFYTCFILLAFFILFYLICCCCCFLESFFFLFSFICLCQTIFIETCFFIWWYRPLQLDDTNQSINTYK